MRRPPPTLRPRLAPGYEVWGRLRLYEPLVFLAVGRAGWRLRHRAVEALALRRGEAVLDLATGTGLDLPPLAAAVGPDGRVVGIDGSPAMLAAARRRLRPPVELVLGDAGRLPFAEASFDAALCCYGLTAVPDPDRAVAELRRVVRPGGRIAAADVHALNWPLPAALVGRLTAALRPFNTWHHERDPAAIMRAQGLEPERLATGSRALSLTLARR